MVDLAIVAKNSAPSTENTAAEIAADFETFWTVYSRHEAKKDARKAWEQLPQNDRPTAITAAVQWRAVWAAKETQYIPLPATWLRGERYFDELPRHLAHTSAAHVPFTPESTETPQKQRMPQFVLDVVAKLRTKP